MSFPFPLPFSLGFSFSSSFSSSPSSLTTSSCTSSTSRSIFTSTTSCLTTSFSFSFTLTGFLAFVGGASSASASTSTSSSTSAASSTTEGGVGGRGGTACGAGVWLSLRILVILALLTPSMYPGGRVTVARVARTDIGEPVSRGELGVGGRGLGFGFAAAAGRLGALLFARELLVVRDLMEGRFDPRGRPRPRTAGVDDLGVGAASSDSASESSLPLSPLEWTGLERAGESLMFPPWWLVDVDCSGFLPAATALVFFGFDDVPLGFEDVRLELEDAEPDGAEILGSGTARFSSSSGIGSRSRSSS